MTIRLIEPLLLAGVETTIGSTLTLPDDAEANYVNLRKAVYTVPPRILDADQRLPIPTILRFPDFYPSILASLVSGATYGQSGNTVTVTATAHGLPTNKNGYRVFWMGSAAIPAGWYFGFTYVDANTFIFQNPAPQTVTAGTAITGALPYTTTTTNCTMTLAGGTSVSGSLITAKMIRTCDNLGGSKQARLFLGNAAIGVDSRGSTGQIVSSMSFTNTTPTSQVGIMAADGTAGTTAYAASADMTQDQQLSIREFLAGASQFSCLDYLALEVNK